LKTLSFRNSPTFFKRSRLDIALGIFIGVAYALVFYSFLYVVRETLRILSLTDQYDLLILSDQEVNFYNLVFALLAVIFGQSASISFWLDRPRMLFASQNYRKISIVNDQNTLKWYFLFWFSKIVIVIWSFVCMAGEAGYYVLSFYPAFNYLFVLTVVVLLLQTWKTIRLSFKRKSIKWFLLTTMVLAMVALGLSRINLLDYKGINHQLLQKNIHYTYGLDLPASNVYNKHNSYFVKNIYLVKNKEATQTDEVLIVADHQELSLEKLKIHIKNWQDSRPDYELRKMVYRLHIDQSVPMKDVNALQRTLSQLDCNKIAYAVVPLYPEYDLRYYYDLSFDLRLPYYNFIRMHSAKILEDINKIPNCVEVKIRNGAYIVNDTLYQAEQLKRKIKSLIVYNTDYIIQLHVDDQDSFASYFRILTTTKEVVYDLRDEYASKEYEKPYADLELEEMSLIRKRYPYSIFKLTEAFKSE
jgi:biopolymer transport protein ExbD